MGTDCTATPEDLVLQEDDQPVEGWNDERGKLIWRPLFSADSTPTDQLVTGVAELEEEGFLALHRHEQAETYYVLTGEGLVTLDGIEHPVRSGSSVFLRGSSEHGTRNTGAQKLRFFYALATNDFADIEYVFPEPTPVHDRTPRHVLDVPLHAVRLPMGHAPVTQPGRVPSV